MTLDELATERAKLTPRQQAIYSSMLNEICFRQWQKNVRQMLAWVVMNASAEQQERALTAARGEEPEGL